MFTRAFERLFVILLLLSSMGVVTALTESGYGGGRRVVSTDLRMSSVIVEAALSLCGGLLVLMRWRRVLSAARTVWPLIGLTALAPLSIAWSVEPLLTLRRSLILLASTVLAIYLGERYSTEKLARLLTQTLCLMMLLVTFVYFVAAAYVIDPSGAWRGLSAYKNAFGEHTAVAVMLLLLVRFRHFCWLRYLFLVTAVVMLVLSHSATSLASCVLLAAAMPLWRLTRATVKQRLLVYTMVAITVVLGVYLIGGNSDLLFKILGRDSTLTGRTHLWGMVIPAIVRHPILGYGYGAFWSVLKGETLDIWIGIKWLTTVADNGYLDLCLDLGMLGVCAFAYVFVQSFRTGMDYLRLESGPIGLWPITYLCFFALHGIFESTLLTTGSFSFLVFVILTTSLAVNHRRTIAAISPTESQPMIGEWAPRALPT